MLSLRILVPQQHLFPAVVRRCYSSSENPLFDAKTKPKLTTPLRRSASASLPIRSNPTPTRGVIQPIFTLATAERYILSRLRAHPNLPAQSQALHDSWWVPKWGQPGKEGEVFVFANGSIVCWGLGEAETKRFAKEVIGRAPGIEVTALQEPETEELEFAVDPIEYAPSFFISRIIIDQHPCQAYATTGRPDYPRADGTAL